MATSFAERASKSVNITKRTSHDIVGEDVGFEDGEFVGSTEGPLVGSYEGSGLGSLLGDVVGFDVGFAVVGLDVVGALVGDPVAKETLTKVKLFPISPGSNTNS